MSDTPAAAQRQLPRMLRIRQNFTCSPVLNIPDAMDSAFQEVEHFPEFPENAQIAVAVGSRGISNLAQIVRETVRKIKSSGGRPFIVPAMGSHGGATAEGQMRVLEHLGVTEANVGAPIRSGMDVVNIGKTADGIEVYVDRRACEAHGIVLISRIKPHTDFAGEIESGTMKMCLIGLGKQKGADYYHRIILEKGHVPVFRSVAGEIFKKLNVLFAIQLVENEKEQTCIIKCTTSDRIEEVEKSLLVEARRMLPTLPVDDIDILIVDEIGKEISGAGMDPNVTGRNVNLYSQTPNRPRVSRIFVRDLTRKTEGSAIGIGNADFVTQRLVDKINFEATKVNCITGCAPEHGRIPLAFENDGKAMEAAFGCIRPVTADKIRIVYIKNTLCLEEICVSEAFEQEIQKNDKISILDDKVMLVLSEDGNWMSPFEKI